MKKRWNGAAVLILGLSLAATLPTTQPSWQELGLSASGGGISKTSAMSDRPSVAFDPGGNPVVAWQDGSEIFVRHWDGTWAEYTWTEGTTLRHSASLGGISKNTSTSQTPSLAVNASGHPAVAWIDSGPNNRNEVYFKRWDGSAWVELVDAAGLKSASGGGVSNNSGAGCVSCSLALDGSGNPVIAWARSSGLNQEIFLKRWNPESNGWEELGLSASAGGISSTDMMSEFPSLALEDSGNPVVVWSEHLWENELEISEIYVRRWNGAGWVGMDGGDASVNVSNTPTESGYPSLALGGNGNPVVAWQEGSFIHLREWNGTAWAELVDAEGRGSATGGGISSGESPSLALYPDGTPVVAWSRQQIFLRHWNGSDWEELAGSASEGGISNSAVGARHPSMAIDATGQIAVAWPDYGVNEIYLKTANLRPPSPPEGLAQLRANGDPIAQGEVLYEPGVKFRATCADPHRFAVKLQVQILPYLSSFSDDVPTVESDLVPTGTTITLTLDAMAHDDYHWRARTVNEAGSESQWVEFGSSGVDFSLNYVPGNGFPGLPSIAATATTGQFLLDGTTALPIGGRTVETGVMFRGTATDPDGNAWQLEVEAKPVGVPFDASNTVMGALAPSGAGTQARLGLRPGFYHWRARAVDEHRYPSAWISFGGNSEDAADFEFFDWGGSLGKGGCTQSPLGGAGFRGLWPALLLLVPLRRRFLFIPGQNRANRRRERR